MLDLHLLNTCAVKHMVWCVLCHACYNPHYINWSLYTYNVCVCVCVCEYIHTQEQIS